MTDRIPIHVIGGSLSAALCAAWFARYLPAGRFDLRVTRTDADLVRSTYQIAGPRFSHFLRTLRISEAELFSRTDSMPIYGVEIALGDSPEFLDTFGRYGALVDGVGFHLAVARTLNRPFRLSELEPYSLAAQLARSGKFATISSAVAAFGLEQGYLLDVDGVTDLLWEKASVFSANLFAEKHSDTGLTILTDTSSTGHQVGWTATDDLFPAYTVEAGTQTQSPRDRAYVRQKIQATEVVLESPDGTVLSRLASDQTRQSGFFKKPWDETGTIRIGPASMTLPDLGGGTLEQLILDIDRLTALLPSAVQRGEGLQAEASEYNRLTESVRTRWLDYLCLAFHVAGDLYVDKLSDAALLKRDLFRTRGRFAIFDDESFLKERYLNLMLGADGSPQDIDPMAAAVPATQIEASLKSLESNIQLALASAPMLAQLMANLPTQAGPR